MLLYIVRRIFSTVPVLIFVALFAFMVSHAAPGDPAVLMAGDDATPELLAQLRRDMGLDRPLIVQFLQWGGQVLRGDLGVSLFSHQPVVGMIAERLAPSVTLMFLTMAIAVTFGIVSGVFAAWQHNRLSDHAIMLLMVALFSIPSFVMGYALTWVLGLKLQWLPVQGYTPLERGFWLSMRSLMLPALALSGAYIAVISRITRSALLENLRQDFVRTARAKGVSEGMVLFRHALKNAAIPIVTVIGSGIGVLISGSVIIENVFAIPGLGRLIVDAVLRHDYPVLQAAILFFGVLYVLVNLLIDLSYTFFDPRIRY